jgi:hypothetical protein
MNAALFSNINWIAVLVAGIAFFMLGAIWYSKILFARTWIRLTGVKADDPNMKGLGQLMAASFILMIVISIGLAIFINRVGVVDWTTGLKVGLLAGICFAASAISISYLYEKRPFGLHLINGIYNIVGCTIAGIIIAAWPK